MGKGFLAVYWLYCLVLHILSFCYHCIVWHMGGHTDTMNGPDMVSSGHMHLSTFYILLIYILLIMEQWRFEIWAIQPVNSKEAFGNINKGMETDV